MKEIRPSASGYPDNSQKSNLKEFLDYSAKDRLALICADWIFYFSFE